MYYLIYQWTFRLKHSLYSFITSQFFHSFLLCCCFSLQFFQVLSNFWWIWLHDCKSFKFIANCVGIFCSRFSFSCFHNSLVIWKPWMLQCLFKCWSLLSIFLKQFLHYVFCFTGNCVPWFKWEIWSVLNSLSCNFFVFFVIEWKYSGQ